MTCAPSTKSWNPMVIGIVEFNLKFKKSRLYSENRRIRLGQRVCAKDELGPTQHHRAMKYDSLNAHLPGDRRSLLFPAHRDWPNLRAGGGMVLLWCETVWSQAPRAKSRTRARPVERRTSSPAAIGTATGADPATNPVALAHDLLVSERHVLRQQRAGVDARSLSTGT